MGLHSTLFGPIKYAILPQALEPDELVGGNALVETGTSLAILIGMIAGGSAMAGAGPVAASILVLAIADARLFRQPRDSAGAADRAGSRSSTGIRSPKPCRCSVS